MQAAGAVERGLRLAGAVWRGEHQLGPKRRSGRRRRRHLADVLERALAADPARRAEVEAALAGRVAAQAGAGTDLDDVRGEVGAGTGLEHVAGAADQPLPGQEPDRQLLVVAWR